MSDFAERSGTNQLLFWLLQAVWALCMSLGFLWINSQQSVNDTQDTDIKNLSREVYTSAESIRNIKDGISRLETKLDRLIEKEGLR